MQDEAHQNLRSASVRGRVIGVERHGGFGVDARLGRCDQPAVQHFPLLIGERSLDHRHGLFDAGEVDDVAADAHILTLSFGGGFGLDGDLVEDQALAGDVALHPQHVVDGQAGEPGPDHGILKHDEHGADQDENGGGHGKAGESAAGVAFIVMDRNLDEDRRMIVRPDGAGNLIHPQRLRPGMAGLFNM